MAKFEVKDGELYIDGLKVIRAWESINGWYWFAVEEEEEGYFYGFVQGFEDEWGYFHIKELEPLMKEGYIWEIRKSDIIYAGRR